MADSIVRLSDSAATFGPFPVPDDEHTARVSILDWGDSAVMVLFAVDLSFDGGASWLPLASAAGNGTGDTRPVGLTLAPLPLICAVCGGEYLPGDDRYDRALSHSTVALKVGRTLEDLRSRLSEGDRSRELADYKTWIAVDAEGRDIDADYFDRVFHTPIPVLPANRQLRVTLTVAGALDSVLTVTTTP